MTDQVFHWHTKCDAGSSAMMLWSWLEVITVGAVAAAVSTSLTRTLLRRHRHTAVCLGVFVGVVCAVLLRVGTQTIGVEKRLAASAPGDHQDFAETADVYTQGAALRLVWPLLAQSFAWFGRVACVIVVRGAVSMMLAPLSFGAAVTALAARMRFGDMVTLLATGECGGSRWLFVAVLVATCAATAASAYYVRRVVFRPAPSADHMPTSVFHAGVGVLVNCTVAFGFVAAIVVAYLATLTSTYDPFRDGRCEFATPSNGSDNTDMAHHMACALGNIVGCATRDIWPAVVGGVDRALWGLLSAAAHTAAALHATQTAHATPGNVWAAVQTATPMPESADPPGCVAAGMLYGVVTNLVIMGIKLCGVVVVVSTVVRAICRWQHRSNAGAH